MLRTQVHLFENPTFFIHFRTAAPRRYSKPVLVGCSAAALLCQELGQVGHLVFHRVGRLLRSWLEDGDLAELGGHVDGLPTNGVADEPELDVHNGTQELRFIFSQVDEVAAQVGGHHWLGVVRVCQSVRERVRI